MEELLKKQQKLRFSGLAPHIKMGRTAERAIKTVFDMASAILMQDWMIYHEDTLSIYFGQRKWTMLYGS